MKAVYKITLARTGESFDVPWGNYSDEAKDNAIDVCLHRVVNDTCAQMARGNYPAGAAGTDAWKEACRQKVRTRLANLANADRPTTKDPLDLLPPDERAAVLAFRAKKSAA